ncbi:MAG: hypothetical protein Q9M21_07305 [Mariprofundaceae bacterium]|nr:hypothetical protein [Mariprofundaceae bacterium]
MTTQMETTTNKYQALPRGARGSALLAPQGWSFIIGTLASLLIATALGWITTATILARKVES